MEIITRKQALEQGLKRYFTGKACKNGHVAERHICGNCVSCHSYEKYREKKIERSKRYAKKNKDKINAYHRKYNAVNKDKIKKWNEGSYEKYRSYYISKSAAGRATKRRAAVFQSERELIQNLYDQCRRISEETGVTHHIDHIIPLVHPLVCGLHVLSNLRIITAEENLHKSNKFEIS